MVDKIVALNEVIEVILKAEQSGETLTVNSLIVELLQAFNVPLQRIKQVSVADLPPGEEIH